LKKEWDEIRRNAEEPRRAGYIAIVLVDDFDLLSVSHFYSLFEKFHLHLLDGDDASRDAQRKALLPWMREIKAVRDPMSHPAEADLPYEDGFRTLVQRRRDGIKDERRRLGHHVRSHRGEGQCPATPRA
jgi:hypothetical protein